MYEHEFHTAASNRPAADSWRVVVVDHCDVFDYVTDGAAADSLSSPEPGCSSGSSPSTGPRVLGKQSCMPASCNSGFSSSKGHRKYMEDRAFMAQGTCKLKSGECQQESVQVFGVCDGHGGSLVAEYCAQRIPHLLSEQLHVLDAANTSPSDVSTSAGLSSKSNASEPALRTQGAQASPPDQDLMSSASAGIESAMVDVYHAVDQGIIDDDCGLSTKAQLMGTTAVTAVVAEQHIWVANCGDSRAVLSCNGTAQALSQDHKACCSKEAARVRDAGGLVVHNFGGPRVMGILTVTRALGDHALRPFGVTSTPEVTRYTRSDSDQFLILASDGLWDALSDQYAVELVSTVFDRVHEKNTGGSLHMLAPRIAARVLTRVALSRGSQDNITVVVVDLRQPLPAAFDGVKEHREETTLEAMDSQHHDMGNPSSTGRGNLEASGTRHPGCDSSSQQHGSSRTQEGACSGAGATRAATEGQYSCAGATGDARASQPHASCAGEIPSLLQSTLVTYDAAYDARALSNRPLLRLAYNVVGLARLNTCKDGRSDVRKRVLSDETNCQRQGKSPRLQAPEVKLVQLPLAHA